LFQATVVVIHAEKVVF
jgi:hypothetical protein